jgi:uncharacterized damage-inducible protein DinB
VSEISLLQTLFRYQAWANGELFDAIGRLDPAHHNKERHLSIRLMNHSLVVGRIFAAHLTGREHGYADDNTPETPSLADLRAALEHYEIKSVHILSLRKNSHILAV